ncbi:hypothetical protein J3A83DRAFT_4106881, partial [Scleroderma citrinum]
THVAEVEYFTCLAVQDEDPGTNMSDWHWKTVAVITMFSCPNPNLFKLSFWTVYACQCQEEDVCIIDVSLINGVVRMVPHEFLGIGHCYFMVEQPGLDIVTFGVPYEGEGMQEDMANDNDDENSSN